ncbi:MULTISPECIES: HD domain-containing protein [unclassified Afipia]|uniref:HD domain-containing protein n=1 Tax=unclassified Afipia TaxID=2642050 RepID=UPI00046566BB|nr:MULTISPECIES: HD domain-containing protein [unclassified Afipia]
MISKISAPDSGIARQAEDLVRSSSSAMLFNHVMRCYWFAELFAKQEQAKADRELMFLSAVLHDLGFTEYGRGPARFEIEGAHAARRFLMANGVAEARAWQVWDIIALHTWDINLYREDAARLVQFGVLYDVIGLPGATLDSDDVAEVVRRFPRLGFKRGFHELLCEELANKQPYEHRLHICTCIAHHRMKPITIPDGQELLNGAPFDE